MTFMMNQQNGNFFSNHVCKIKLTHFEHSLFRSEFYALFRHRALSVEIGLHFDVGQERHFKNKTSRKWKIEVY